MSQAESSWYVKFPEKVSGPFSLEQLQKLALNGRITPQHLASHDQTTWRELKNLDGLNFSSATTAAHQERSVIVQCVCGNTFAIPASYAGLPRPCPKCAAKCLVPDPPANGSAVVADNNTIALRCECGQEYSVLKRYADVPQSCPQCGRKSRAEQPSQRGPFVGRPYRGVPSSFRLVTLAGLIWALLSIVFAAALVLVTMQEGMILVAAVIVVTPLIRGVVFMGLRLGQTWTWFAAQALAALELAGVAMLFALYGWPALVAGSIAILIYVPLLFMLYGDDVRRHLR